MFQRVHQPEALDRRHALWPGARFDAGRRSYTETVEGVTRTGGHLLLVTLAGGARRMSAVTDCGHRYEGIDRPGAVSFVPALCERTIRLDGVAAEWASIALDPDAVRFGDDDRSWAFAPFSNVDDPFVAGLVAELDRLHRADGALDPAYGETMGFALARYMARRYGRQADRAPARAALPA